MTTAATPRAVPATVRVVLFALDGTVSVPAVTDTLATWQHLVAGSIEFVRLLSPLAAAPRDELVAIINEGGPVPPAAVAVGLAAGRTGRGRHADSRSVRGGPLDLRAER